MLTIRREMPKDYPQIYELVKSAFEKAEHRDGDEQDLVNRLRQTVGNVPELALVAEVEGELAGHVMFTQIKVGETTQLCLAPLAVAPRFQSQGVGGALIKAGHRIAQELGYEFSILIGHPSYYPRFGYVNASEYGIKSPIELPEDVFMAINLQGKKTYLNATVEFPRVFFEKE